MEVFNLAEELEKERKKNKELEDRIDSAINYIENSALNKGLCTRPETDTIQVILDILKGE